MNRDRKMEGSCCSQTIMSLSLDDLGKENKDMLAAMTHFCAGMGKGEICGALAGAIAALHVRDPHKAADIWQDEFMDWFYGRFGAYDCNGIIACDKARRDAVCMKLILETCLRLRGYISPIASQSDASNSAQAKNSADISGFRVRV